MYMYTYNLYIFFSFLFQLYEIDNNPKRKIFLDELFAFMQNRGKFVNGSSTRLYVSIMVF